MVTYIVDGTNCSRVIWKSDNTGESFSLVCNNRMNAEVLERALRGCYHIETVPEVRPDDSLGEYSGGERTC